MLLSSSNRKYPPVPLLSYFSVVVCLGCLLHHILSLIAYTFRENRESVFIIIVQFMMSANGRIRFALQIVLVYLYSTPSHYHHCARLSGDIELIKCLSHIFCRVCKINHILSVVHYAIHYTICGAVCFQFTHSLMMIERIYILCLIINIKSEVWTITHSLGLGHETMVYAVWLSIFLETLPVVVRPYFTSIKYIRWTILLGTGHVYIINENDYCLGPQQKIIKLSYYESTVG